MRCIRAFATVVVGVSVSAQGVKLNTPLARPEGGEVPGFVVSPDGMLVAYVVAEEGEHEEETTLFVVPSDRQKAPIQVNRSLPEAGEIEAESVAFSPDGAHVFFLAGEEEAGGGAMLWVASSSIPQSAISLGPAGAYVVAPGSSRVVYVGDAFMEGVDELYSATLNGGVLPVRLNAPLPSGARVRDFGEDAPCVFTSDEHFVLYVADQEVAGRDELFRVPVDGSAPPVKLNAPLVADGNVGVPDGEGLPMAIGAGGRAVYVADQEVDGRFELFSVPLDASAPPIKLNGPLVTGGGVGEGEPAFVLSADGTQVLYVADETVAGAFELRSVPIDGSVPSVSLTPGLPAGRGIEQYVFDADGRRAYFVADLRADDRFELFCALADGTGPLQRLSGELVDGGNVDRFELTPDGRWIVYAADQETAGEIELYRVAVGLLRRAQRLVGSREPVKISAGITLEEGFPTFALTADGARVVFSHEEELYAAPLLSGHAPILLDDEYLDSLGLEPFQVAGSERVVYLRGSEAKDAEEDEPPQVFSIELDGAAPPLRLNDDLPEGEVLGDVFGCDFSPGGQWVVYEADGDEVEHVELYVASTTGRRTRKLNGALDPIAPARLFHPDGERILFLATDAGAQGHVPYLAPLDGSEAPAIVGGPYPAGRSVDASAFTPDGSRLILSGDVDTAGQTEIYNAPVDGGAPRFKLSPALAVSENAGGPRLSTDGQEVLFTTSLGSTTRLFAVPVDRSQEPVMLVEITQGSLEEYAFTPDGQHALYAVLDSTRELYGVPIDGSQPAALLSPPLGSGSALDFVVAPDSSRVVFRETLGLVPSLQSVPVAGGTPATLSPALGSGAALSGGLVSPDSAFVVFTATDGSDTRLYRAPIDGSSAAIALDAPGGSADDAHLTSDGLDVVYRGAQTAVGAGILRVPLDGSTLPVRISPEISPTAEVTLDLTPDGLEAVYATEGPQPSFDELYRVPVDGSRPARRLDRPAHGSIADDGEGPRFRISANSRAVIYRAEREEVIELYLSLLDGPWVTRGFTARSRMP